MKINKKVIESAAVAVFTLVITITSITAGNVNTKAEQYTGEDEIQAEENQVAVKEKAVVDLVATAIETGVTEIETGVTEIETGAAEIEDTEANALDEEAVEAESQEESEWATKLMPNVETYLNIRSEANEEAEVVGKLYKGSSAEILERGEIWSKISSGNVEGYVKNEYCVFDAEAEAMAMEQGTVYATSLTGGLRVRGAADASEDTDIVDILEEGKKIKVDVEAEAPEGWVAVKTSGITGYVSAEYVSVELELGKAVSIEEELAAARAAQKEKEKKAAAAAANSKPAAVQNAPTAASYDDVTLLGALIQCEAGGECYEGKVAVGAVVMNRLRCGYAGSIYGVIYQSGQFSPASSGALARRLANGVDGSCISAAQEAINGVDNVGGALSFSSTRSGRAGIVIGNHVFY